MNKNLSDQQLADMAKTKFKLFLDNYRELKSRNYNVILECPQTRIHLFDVLGLRIFKKENITY